MSFNARRDSRIATSRCGRNGVRSNDQVAAGYELGLADDRPEASPQTVPLYGVATATPNCVADLGKWIGGEGRDPAHPEWPDRDAASRPTKGDKGTPVADAPDRT